MLGEVDLQLVSLASIEGARRSGDLDYPPVHSNPERILLLGK
jgi:hypothetical protein